MKMARTSENGLELAEHVLNSAGFTKMCNRTFSFDVIFFFLLLKFICAVHLTLS